MSKESLAQQGGYYLTNKGPQHDEAWLIFMDMVNNQHPHLREEGRGPALLPHVPHLVRPAGPVQAALERHRARRQRQVRRSPTRCPSTCRTTSTSTPPSPARTSTKEEPDPPVASGSTTSSASSTCSHGPRPARKDDYPPYRAMGPVTVEEYESRAERYDKADEGKDQSIDPAGKSTRGEDQDHCASTAKRSTRA
ncbi:MAG: hypothetical protein MZV63_46765 [Marinilabiliales bacterium]|nr:hypothetical protein [Marinilabiliales bacterium]